MTYTGAIMKIKLTIFIFLIVLITGCHSSGIFNNAYEFSTTPASTSAFLIVRQNMSLSSPWVRNFSIPKVITPYLLTGFTYYDGTISMNNAYEYNNAYRGNKIVENISGYNIYEIPFTEDYLNVIKEQYSSEMEIIYISFSMSDLINSNNELLNQPAGYAVIKGIKNSNKGSGEICLLNLKYNDNGQFQAYVGIK